MSDDRKLPLCAKCQSSVSSPPLYTMSDGRPLCDSCAGDFADSVINAVRMGELGLGPLGRDREEVERN